MYIDLGEVELNDGERVRACAIQAPDAEWRAPFEHLLGHKGDIWRWQIGQVLDGDPQVLLGAQAFFYGLHREGEPAFSNIMTIEFGGVGVVGHVWTVPHERGKGAASHTMNSLTRHFRERGGQALYLSTGFASSAFRIYNRHGFEPVEPNSGVMSFTTSPKAQFEEAYFAPGDASIGPVGWPAWATASALTTGDFPGVVRNLRYRLLGHALTEEQLLYAMQDEEEQRANNEPSRTLALRKDNGAVVGLASCFPHPLWPNTSLIDVHCHPNFWNRAGDLLSQLSPPSGQRLAAYADMEDQAKAQALQAAGFERVSTLPNWVAADYLGTQLRDVAVWSKA